MKKTIKFVLAALFFIFAVGLFFVSESQAAFHFLDGKLRVKGSIYEFIQYRTKLKRDDEVGANNEKQYRDTAWGLVLEICRFPS